MSIKHPDCFWDYCATLLITLSLAACQSEPANRRATLPAAPTIPPVPTIVPTPTPLVTPVLPAGDALQVTIDRPFELAIGQQATLADAGLYLLVEQILEDSRCPRQVACVWSGQVRLSITFWGQDSAYETREFSTVARQPYGTDTQVFQGYVIKLVNVQPYPIAPGTPIPRGDYRITLLISHTQ